jgi:hypothetical protein
MPCKGRAPLNLMRSGIRFALFLLPLLWLTACEALSDPATRIAYAMEGKVSHLASRDGSRYTIRVNPPSGLAASGGSYSVQFDKVGALIVWYKDAGGKVTESGSTSYYSRFVDTPQTYKVTKPGSMALLIDFEREGGRAVIVNVR